MGTIFESSMVSILTWWMFQKCLLGKWVRRSNTVAGWEGVCPPAAPLLLDQGMRLQGRVKAGKQRVVWRWGTDLGTKNQGEPAGT